MCRFRCIHLLALTALAVGVWGVGGSISVGQRLPGPEELPAPRRLAGYRGAASCAAAACHGETGSAGSQGCEYTTWMGRDRHARAYQVLLTERSRTIARNYFPPRDGTPVRPEQEMACLRCHALDAVAARQGLRVAFEDGIGCERCHGPADRWLAQHYLPDWRQKTTAEKEALGFRPTKDLGLQARLCVDCHVGAPGSEVDHDLIAAGHPRLNFELSSFLAIMPPHWDRRAERARQPDLEAKVWAIGQVASTQAALHLLAYRADPANGKPWPEFAEYDCRACHQDLRPGRSSRGSPNRAPGTLTWSDWYTALPRLLDFKGSPLAVPGLANDLKELGTEMAKPLPDRGEVAAQARAAAARLGPRLTALDQARPWDAVWVHRLFDQTFRRRNVLANHWDGEAQTYLALGALYHAMTDLDPALRSPALREQLRSMANRLRSGPK